MIFLTPRTLYELWEMTAAHPDYRFMAGGTDLMVRLRQNPRPSLALIGLENIRDFRGIEEKGGNIHIGAATPLTELLNSPPVKHRLGVLHQACKVLGSPLIRNMATLGGNICTASPAGDTLPALYVLKARLNLMSRQGNREIPISDFIRHPGHTDLKPGEILHSVIVPIPDAYHVHHFEKVGQRNALAIAVVSLAALLEMETGVVRNARLAWGSVGPTIVQSREVEQALEGGPLSLSRLSAAAATARRVVSPISDIRASQTYRREVAGNLLLRLASVDPVQPAHQIP